MTIFLFLKHYRFFSLLLALLSIASSSKMASAQSSHSSPLQSNLQPSSSHPQASPLEINSIPEQLGPTVQELSNIYLTDWEYLQLRTLAERYRLPASLNQLLHERSFVSRQEFAIALETLVAHILRQRQPLPSKDLEVLQTLQNAYRDELNLLTQRTDRLIPHLEKLQEKEFSTTTQLQGEVLFSGIGVGGNPVEDEAEIGDRRITFGYRARLSFITSFTGRDRLRLRLQASSIGEVDEATGTNMTRPAFQSNTDGQLVLNRLDYSFPLGKKTEFLAKAIGGTLSNFADPLNPHLDSGSRGTISRFGVRNPIYRQGRGTGVGLIHEFGKGFSLGLGYLADDAGEPSGGLIGGSYGAIAQLTYQPSKKFGIGINYIRAFNALDTNTGSERANDPFNRESEAIVTNSLGLQSFVQIVPKVYLGGWVGFTHARASDLPGDPAARILNWATTLSVLDVGAQNSLLGIIVGQPPKLIHNQYAADGQSYIDPDTSLHLEAFYRWPIRENMAITAGILAITNPEHNTNNDTAYVGIVRTLFRF
ncbi:iron uptake porin [Altericista sp. CCNU0014]|uniref:iron uptake porin n=1 Tax=Altericista sp. CCNU0014 TaxID=3082949 RepID=UPI00384B7930